MTNPSSVHTVLVHRRRSINATDGLAARASLTREALTELKVDAASQPASRSPMKSNSHHHCYGGHSVPGLVLGAHRTVMVCGNNTFNRHNYPMASVLFLAPFCR